MVGSGQRERILQSDATTPEYEDLDSHRQMWGSFTGFITKSLISIVIGLLLIAWITGVF